MATCRAVNNPIYTLELTAEEREYLKGVLQNGPANEGVADEQLRTEIWKVLNKPMWQPSVAVKD